MTATTQPVTQEPPRRIGGYLARRPVVALIFILALLYAVTAIQDPSLLQLNGVRSILLLACPLAILAACQTVAMLTGGIDLSSAMIANFAAYVCANNAGAGPVLALLLAFLVGGAIGAINGIGIGVFRVNALIMTLGMSSVLIGVVTVGIVGNGFLSGSTRILPLVATVGGGTLIGPIPFNSVVLVAVSVLLVWGLGRTGLGRTIYATGDNEPAVRPV